VALAAASLLGVGAIVASSSGAATAMKTKHPKHRSTPTVTFAQVEPQLTTLEALSTTGAATLTEAGSSLFYPLWEEWAGANPPVKLNPAAGGSGLGQSEAESGIVDVGASDAFLPPSELAATPKVLNIPVDVSAQAVVYNVPGVPITTNLKLNASILNNIYDGAITKWNAAPIAKLNPGVALPDLTIVPIRRSDSSGDTFIFTAYLFYGDKTSWTHLPTFDGASLYYATWPTGASNELAEKGNSGLLAAVTSTTGGIGYLGGSYLPKAEATGTLGYAALENGSGNFELPTLATVEDEVSSFKNIPADGAISLIDSKTATDGYPIVNFEYAIVLQQQSSTVTANAIKATLAWAMDPRDGSATTFLSPLLFNPLPANALAVAAKLVESIS
jgi:phosphate transport system substrate-binding protein